MTPSEVGLALMGVCVALGVVARWLGTPYPILLAVGGLLLAVQDWAPQLPPLDPDLVFTLFLPPLLYAGAYNTHWPAFRSQLRAIALLAIGLVLFTMAAVAAVAHYHVGMGWGPAVVLGAIVSPPDAVAAMAVTRRVRVPRIVTTLLEGESLVNDASALVALRLAVAWVAGETITAGGAAGQFVLASAGGLGIGVAGGWLAIRLHRWLDRNDLADSKLTITITLLTPYAVYLPAEHLHVSGVLAVVAAGLWVGSRCESVFTRDLFDEARAVWEMVEFLLNSAIFILIGFQFPRILEHLREHPPGRLAGYAAAVCAAVVVARVVWVFPGAYLPRWLDRAVLGKAVVYPPWQAVTVVAWTGMRGVVSLAAALALPMHGPGDGFPDRGLIQFLTFWVIFATLVGQGLTLPLVIRALGVDRLPDPAEEKEVARVC